MFFLLRCVFWLSIVYSSMSWAVGPSTDGLRAAAAVGQPAALRQAVLDGGLALAGAARAAAVDGATAWCVNSPRQCLADATQLTALVSANQAEDLGDPAADAASIALFPLPPVDPRRHATPRS